MRSNGSGGAGPLFKLTNQLKPHREVAEVALRGNPDGDVLGDTRGPAARPRTSSRAGAKRGSENFHNPPKTPFRVDTLVILQTHLIHNLVGFGGVGGATGTCP